jgi:hypothetical protein
LRYWCDEAVNVAHPAAGVCIILWGIEVKGRSIEEIDEQFARQTPTGVQAGHAAGT